MRFQVSLRSLEILLNQLAASLEGGHLLFLKLLDLLVGGLEVGVGAGQVFGRRVESFSTCWIFLFNELIRRRAP